MTLTVSDVEEYLADVYSAVQSGRYQLSARQKNQDMFIDYVFTEEDARQVLLSLKVIRGILLMKEEAIMMNKIRVQFCTECREETQYRIRSISYVKQIRDKEYVFEVAEAICCKCGNPVNFAGLMDRNAREIDRQYRMQEGLVSIEDVNNLMELYKLGKAPLSLALGFGEITITRYLAGQVPSKEYSEIMRKALESPAFMVECLRENREKIGETAYKKAMQAAKELEPIFALSEKMLLTISYIFKRAGEVTPLALQKILYFVQGIHMVLYNKELFCEECEAWAHGPVYREVYEVFKSFKYNPIDDTRFAMLQNRFHELSGEEKRVIDLVLDSFGVYSGKVLEQITHAEAPWNGARENCFPGEPSTEVISKESIKSYFAEVAKTFELDSVKGLKEYILNKLEPCTEME